ncbi:MAG: Flagellar hook-associated protein 3 FlgL [Hydrocarboniphaga sp.]|uniref:flagellar hook-associated protein FlgL n=1 Tax=Hydrocarboniphaga sp. TaxID=2033016 RepID=UPI00262750BC|nr:flagellar hook-associated protein FlgL [Hydrocarboniphaga sp.]MDB5967586.1 Flagellar hook-associated protein 3 FlgL [Hydrocarboniphaga sp.]
MSLRVTTAGLFQQGVASMQAQSQALAKLQSQMATNMRYTRAGEDPVAAARALNVDKALADAAQWTSNIGSAQDRLNLEEGALSGATDALSRIRELAVMANSGTATDSDRKSIAQEMTERLSQLMSQANARDGQGGYIFSGSRTQSRPFDKIGSSFIYQGDTMVSQLAIGSNRDISMSDAGNDVFMSIGSGNGQIAVSAGSGNQGSTIVQNLGFSDSSLWDGGTYSIGFSAGNYSVLDAAGNLVSSGVYTANEAISLRGASITLNGAPSDGDTFTIAPSQQQDVFTTVQNMIDVVSGSGRTPAQTSRDQTTMYNTLQSLDTAIDHITDVRGGVGARLNALDDAGAQLDARSVQLQETLSGLREIDYTSAAAQLSQTTTTLQAAQQSYLKIQSLSLFDYLR